jgi:hypothetical protein
MKRVVFLQWRRDKGRGEQLLEFQWITSQRYGGGWLREERRGGGEREIWK